MTSSKPNYLPPLTEEDRTVFINRKIFDEMNSVLSVLVTWGSKKSDSQSFDNYLISKGFTNSHLKEIFGKEIQKLAHTSFTGFDMTFMCQILPLVCSSIKEQGSPEWSDKDETKVECQLYKLREMRNAVMHNAEGMATDRNLFKEVKNIVTTLLENAGKLYSKTPDEIEKAEVAVINFIDGVKTAVMTEREKGSCQYRKVLIEEGIPEIRKQVKNFKGNHSPYLEPFTSFYYFQLFSKEMDDSKPEKIISCKKILKYCTEKALQILLIEGQAGAYPRGGGIWGMCPPPLSLMPNEKIYGD